jgi:hypothetical protein
MSAIERIQGFACEVTQEQWEELVRVADSVGVQICDNLMIGNSKMRIEYSYVGGEGGKILVGWKTRPLFIDNLIPYPNFLSKLKGEEKWDPKNGDCVEVSNDDFTTCVKGSYIGVDKESGYHVIRLLGYIEYISKAQVRQFIPTITRQEAEAILNKRIID